MAKQAPGIDAFSPFGTAAQITIDRLYGQMMGNLAGTRSGEDIEALHDMRVASRRLRAALRVFGVCFPKARLRRVVAHIQNVTRALGTVRDLDVFLDYFRAYQKDSGSDISWLIQRVEGLREEARQEMFFSLDELEHGELPAEMDGLLSRVLMMVSDGRTGVANRFHAQAPGLIAPRMKELLSLSCDIEDSSKVAELHQMRIAAKRLRYTLETFVPCFGRPLVDQIDRLKELQELLGQVHDSDIWMGKLREYHEENEVSPEQACSLDALIANRHAHRDKMYDEVLAHWHKLCEEEFPRRIETLANSVPTIDNPTIEGVATMEMDVKTEAVAETAVETPAAKPTRTRTTRSAAKPAADKAAAPAARRTRAPRTTSTSTPAAKPTTRRASATKAAKPVEEAPVKVVAVTPAVAPPVAEHHHPVVVELKEMVQRTMSHLTSSNVLSNKMAGQLGKVEAVLEQLPGTLQKLTVKEAAKAEKWMSDLKGHLHTMTADGGLSAKKAEKLRMDVRDVRRKLADIAPKKGKK